MIPALRVVLALTIAALIPASAVGQPGRATPTSKVAATLRLDWVPGPHHVGPVLAVQRGYYADEGIDLTVSPGRGSGGTVQIIASGRELFGFADAGAMAIAAGKDAPVIMVANTTPRGPAGVLTLGAKIASPEELKGKSIGMVLGADTVQFEAVMRKYGLSASASRIVAIEAASKVPALLSHQVDLITGFRFGDYLRAYTQNKDAKITLYSEWGVNMLGNGYIVSTSTLAEKPELVRAFLRATMHGWKDAIADHKAGVAALMAAFPDTNRQYIELGLPWVIEHMESERTKGKPLGWMAEGDWTTTIDVLKAAGLLEGSRPARSYYRNVLE
jgi:NitT/TauT family transport system substrate-binding protein